jgi:hypothetical protein
MNYRRGFQRLYVLLSVLWVGGVLALSIHDRPRTKIDYDALARQAGAIQVDPAEVRSIPSPPPGYRLDAPSTPFVPPPLSSYQGDAPEDRGPLSIVKSEPLPGAIRSFWISSVAVALLPPLALYLFLFYVMAWVYRGFRPRTQN